MNRTVRQGIARQWRKSSYSCANGQCVEVASPAAGDAISVRDSKNPRGPIVGFSSDAWGGFLTAAKRGGFDAV